MPTKKEVPEKEEKKWETSPAFIEMEECFKHLDEQIKKNNIDKKAKK